jgi:hypothetical protein
VSSFLALAVLASTASPCLAGEVTKTDVSKVPIIRVVIDNENQLALVPEGTVLPGGFQILSSIELKANASDVPMRAPATQRPLVFAYAPAERFAGLEAVEIPRDGRKEVVEFNFPVGPEANVTKSSNPCPVTIVVEVSPEVTHQMTCWYLSFGPGNLQEDFISYTSFPTTATKSRLTMVTDYAPPWTDVRNEAACFIPSGECTSWQIGFGLPFLSSTNVVSNASVRTLGACTQDPPFCPFITNSIVLPVLMP